jgi:hypothetical protein
VRGGGVTQAANNIAAASGMAILRRVGPWGEECNNFVRSISVP